MMIMIDDDGHGCWWIMMGDVEDGGWRCLIMMDGDDDGLWWWMNSDV